jgi:hypothetical protein
MDARDEGDVRTRQWLYLYIPVIFDEPEEGATPPLFLRSLLAGVLWVLD